MRYPLEAIDCDGNRILTGDNVIFMHASENLLRGLPEEDQRAIRSYIGEIVKVDNIDEEGYAELEFIEEDYSESHTIWVEPRHLKKA
ncbi:MAG: hypothetical protein HZC51_09565 [Nitrospirae bacterium]|nr:hypothetical protein [Nitrospirota bacterium]